MAPYGPDWGVAQGKEPQIPLKDPQREADDHHPERLGVAVEHIVRPPMRHMLAYGIPADTP